MPDTLIKIKRLSELKGLKEVVVKHDLHPDHPTTIMFAVDKKEQPHVLKSLRKWLSQGALYINKTNEQK